MREAEGAQQGQEEEEEGSPYPILGVDSGAVVAEQLDAGGAVGHGWGQSRERGDTEQGGQVTLGQQPGEAPGTPLAVSVPPKRPQLS